MTTVSVIIERDGADLMVRRVGDDESSEPRALAGGLSADDYDDLRWYVERYLDLPHAGNAVRAASVEERLPGWGRRIAEQLGMTKAPIDDALRLVVRCSDPAAARWPWELAADAAGPLIDRGVTIVRSLGSTTESSGAAVQHAAIALPLRILSVVARPDDLGAIDPRSTIAGVVAAIEESSLPVDIDVCTPPTQTELSARLRQAYDSGQPYHVVHIDGHGTTLPRIGGVLCFEQPPADVFAPIGTDYLSAPQLADLLEGFDVMLVILEACGSGQVGDDALSTAIAPALIEAGIANVVCMAYAVHIDATRMYMEALYRTVLTGESLATAHGAGQRAMRGGAKRRTAISDGFDSVDLADWFVPQLYQRDGDMRLEASGARAPSTGTLDALPPAPPNGFIGRDHELHGLQRSLAHKTTVIVYGMGGTGKSALATECARWLLRTGQVKQVCHIEVPTVRSVDDILHRIGEAVVGRGVGDLDRQTRRARVTEAFVDERILVVLDGLEEWHASYAKGAGGDHTEALESTLALAAEWSALPDPAGRLVITSRTMDVYLPGAFIFPLLGLSDRDAQILFDTRRRRADSQVVLEDVVLSDLLRLTERQPLAIEALASSTATGFDDAADALIEELLLRASLERAWRNHTEPANAVAPWIALFSRGFFEAVLLEVSGLADEDWNPARWELEQLGLLFLDWEMQIDQRPFVRLHPLLPRYLRRQGRAVPDQALAQERFVDAYVMLVRAAASHLWQESATTGTYAFDLEDFNIRRAIELAKSSGRSAEATYLWSNLATSLDKAGRRDELDAFSEWVQHLFADGDSGSRADLVNASAEALLRDGEPAAAATLLLEELGQSLQDETADVTFAECVALRNLGRSFVNLGELEQARDFLEMSLEGWQTLIERAEGDARSEFAGAAATLGTYSNACLELGQHHEAREAAQRALDINLELGDQVSIAVAKSQLAGALLRVGFLDGAEALLVECVEVAEAAKDPAFEATLEQNLGEIAAQRGDGDEAIDRYTRAYEIQHKAGDEAAAMVTANLIGSVELRADRFDEARSWFEVARDTAERRGNEAMRCYTLQNLGITDRREGSNAIAEGDAAGQGLLSSAISYLTAAVDAWAAIGNVSNLGTALYQLSVAHRDLGDLGGAEGRALESLRVDEELDNAEGVMQDLGLLASIARARGDEAAAAEWESRRTELVNSEPFEFDDHMVAVLHDTALLCANEGLFGEPVPASERALVIEFAGERDPLGAVGRFCMDLLEGKLAEPPAAVTGELRDVLVRVVRLAELAKVLGRWPPAKPDRAADG